MSLIRTQVGLGKNGDTDLKPRQAGRRGHKRTFSMETYKPFLSVRKRNVLAHLYGWPDKCFPGWPDVNRARIEAPEQEVYSSKVGLGDLSYQVGLVL